jgi:hypothetical protein
VPKRREEETRGLLAVADHGLDDPMPLRRRKSIAMASRSRSNRGGSPPPSPLGHRHHHTLQQHQRSVTSDSLEVPLRAARPRRGPSGNGPTPRRLSLSGDAGPVVVTPAHEVIAASATPRPRPASPPRSPSRAPLPPAAPPTLLTTPATASIPFHERLSQPRHTNATARKTLNVSERHHHFAARQTLRPSPSEEMAGQRRAFREQRAPGMQALNAPLYEPEAPNVRARISTLKSHDSIMKREIEGHH